jgi:hypothetical protein
VTVEPIRHYGGLLTPGLREQGLCVTYVRGIGDRELILAFGGDPATVVERTLQHFYEELGNLHHSEMPDVLGLTDVGDWILGVEPNGYQGSRSEVLTVASTVQEAISVFWNSGGDSEFNYSVGGELIVAFEPAAPEMAHGSNPQALDGFRHDLDFGAGKDDLAAAFALAERVTGVRITSALLNGVLRCMVLDPVPDEEE